MAAITVSDTKILKRIKEADREVLIELYLKNEVFISNYILKQGETKNHAKEILQQTLVLFWQNSRRIPFELPAKLDRYLLSLSKEIWTKKPANSATIPVDEITDRENIIVKETNKTGTLRQKTRQDFPSIAMQEKKDFTVVEHALDLMEDQSRNILIMYYFDRFDMDTIAKANGLNNVPEASARKKECMEQLQASIIENYNPANRPFSLNHFPGFCGSGSIWLDDERIDHYLDGEMSKEQVDAFLKEVRNNSDVLQYIEMQQFIIEGIQNDGSKELTDFIANRILEEKENKLGKRNIWNSIIGISVLLLFGFVLSTLYNKKSLSEQSLEGKSGNSQEKNMEIPQQKKSSIEFAEQEPFGLDSLKTQKLDIVAIKIGSDSMREANSDSFYFSKPIIPFVRNFSVRLTESTGPSKPTIYTDSLYGNSIAITLLNIGSDNILIFYLKDKYYIQLGHDFYELSTLPKSTTQLTPISNSTLLKQLKQ
ncbi:MAG: sigma-70 family RNA polymerase sigma factor [Flavobacteriaceae bacterium]|nr:sigma-70 family RNA polymerase sigma factor [Flavobacteriaceae bacterium]